jgi:nucleotide-binding universal stress UspA family protein
MMKIYVGPRRASRPGVRHEGCRPARRRSRRSRSGRPGLAFAPGLDETDLDAAREANAKARSNEGADRARRAGLYAQSRTRAQATTVAEAIIAEAADIEASAIVIGSRGLTGLKSVLLGSVSHAVLQHADLPVIVVPSAEIATARRACPS